MMRLALCMLVLASCTDFTDITRGVCGNGLLEPGEDCDSEARSCVRCAVTCEAAADCPDSTYACGNDGFCHAPSSQFAEATTPQTFQADDLRITDIDRDGAGDVIGVSKTSVIVRKGDAAGSLSTGTSFVTPAQTATPAFGDLDGDGTIDLTLATPDGIVELTSRFGTLSPVAIEAPLFAETGEPMDFLRLFQPSSVELGGLISIADTVQLVIVSFIADPPRTSFAAPCFARLGALTKSTIDLATLDIYRVTADGALANELVVSFLTSGGALCVTSIHGNALTGYAFDDITPPGAATRSRKPILADLDLDNDPCPALINSDGGAVALKQFDGSKSGDHCVLAAGANGAALPPMPQAPSDAVAIGRLELSPRIDGIGRDALVMTSGVYGNVPNAIPVFFPVPIMTELYSSTGRTLGFVATGDLDNDGDLDAVLATSDQDDLDVLFRFPNGLQLVRIDSASVVSSLTLADVDGNGVRDIAYTELAGDHHDLMIAYGTVDRPLAPVQVSSFSGVGAVSVLRFPDSVDTLSLADDLAIIQPGAGTDGNSLLSMLHGSPQRTMLSFFDPRTEARRNDTFLYGLVVGDFVVDPPALHRDLIAFGIGESVARAWPVAGTPLGLDTTPSDGVPAILPNLFTELFAWPTSAGKDVVLAVDREQPIATVLDPFDSFATTEATALVDGLPGNVNVRSLYAADLDGDGRAELVASFQDASATTGEVRICAMSERGVPTSCEDVTAIVQHAEPSVTACLDASPDGADLVILCAAIGDAKLFRMTPERVIEPVANAPGMRAIRIGDVTGDGLADLVGLAGNSITVLARCSTRDLDACGSEAR